MPEWVIFCITIVYQKTYDVILGLPHLSGYSNARRTTNIQSS